MTEGIARVVVGRYRLVRPLGRGGMGTVWHAEDTLLGRHVAVKEIWLHNAGHEPADPADPLVRRALREAQAAARLRHPGIVTVYDVVTDEGRPWIVMELINGQSLAEAIREHGLLTEQRTAEIGLQVLDALRAAHREGIAHRDIKPANILLDAAERVVLTDFGIAAIDDATALTATGQMVGSPAYLAPERINGQPATAASDLWALGVTLYTAVTGRSPFQREDTQATFAAILTSRPAVPAHAGRLWPVIKGLLDKDPTTRLGTEQARKLLANVAHPAHPGGPAPGRRSPRWWPARSPRRESTLDGLPGTLAAPPPTLAAATAFQEAPPALPGQAKAQPPGSPAGEPAAQPDDTTRPDDTTQPDDTAVGGAPTETVVAEPATAAAATVTAETVTAETAGIAALPLISAPVPLAPYPEIARQPRTVRTRTVWLAALAVGSVLVAGGIIRAAWPGSDDGGEPTGGGPVAGSSALARAESVKPPAPSAKASAPVNPSLDSCLVGTWQSTSMQLIMTIDGVQRRFTSPGGHTLRIWPDGKSTEDYTKMTPPSATIGGAKWAYKFRGVQTTHVETRSGRVYFSEIANNKTPQLTRNGKVRSSNPGVTPSYDLPYICGETKLTTYGNEKVSTDSYKRVSHTP